STRGHRADRRSDYRSYPRSPQLVGRDYCFLPVENPWQRKRKIRRNLCPSCATCTSFVRSRRKFLRFMPRGRLSACCISESAKKRWRLEPVLNSDKTIMSSVAIVLTAMPSPKERTSID